jgi:hypothetical protein
VVRPTTNGFPERKTKMDQQKVDFNVEVFTGSNEQALFDSTLNNIEQDDLPSFIKALNDFADLDSAAQAVTEIIFDGCDDTILKCKSGREIMIDSETTFKEMINLLKN